jgi:hypothetical protein
MRAVLRHCRAQNRRDGTKYGVPPVFDREGRPMPKIALALVAVDERGRVRASAVFERTLELMCFGGGEEVTGAMMDEAPAIFYALREMGYQDFHVLVPKTRVSQIEDGLTKRLCTARVDGDLAHFYREL